MIQTMPIQDSPHDPRQEAMLRQFAEHAEACMQTARENGYQLDLAAQLLADTVARGGRILLCGAGDTAFWPAYTGSRLSGVLERERPPLPALVLHHDAGWPLLHPAGTAQALPPDLLEQQQQGVAQAIVQQLQQLGQPDDVLWLCSADDAQPFAQQALAVAQSRDIPVLWLHGGDSAMPLLSELDVDILLAQPRGLRLLEQCLLATHVVCDALDRYLLGEEEIS